MMANCVAYQAYADEVLGPQMDQKVLKRIKELEAAGEYTSEEYEALLMPHHYEKHVLRKPIEQWPTCVLNALEHANNDLYVYMQGPSEFGISGKLEKWSCFNQLNTITIPTLVIGAKHDTMDPEHMEEMSKRLPKGSYLFCPNGSHMAFYDDQQTYFKGLLAFLKK